MIYVGSGFPRYHFFVAIFVSPLLRMSLSLPLLNESPRALVMTLAHDYIQTSTRKVMGTSKMIGYDGGGGGVKGRGGGGRRGGGE